MSEELVGRLRSAISDPKAVVGNRVHTSFGDDYDETLSNWSARAVMAVLQPGDDAIAAARRAVALEIGGRIDGILRGLAGGKSIDAVAFDLGGMVADYLKETL